MAHHETMIVPIQILLQVSRRVHITHSPCRLRGIHSGISWHSVLVVMLHSSLAVADSTGHRQEDSIRMTHPIRHLLHGSEFSLSPPIIQNTSISIQGSILSSRHKHEEDELVSVQPHQPVDLKYGQEQLQILSSTSVDHRMSDLVSRDSTLL